MGTLPPLKYLLAAFKLYQKLMCPIQFQPMVHSTAKLKAVAVKHLSEQSRHALYGVENQHGPWSSWLCQAPIVTKES